MSMFEHHIRVYYEDTDTAGIVFYANYLKFFERARTEWLRSLGAEQSQLAKEENTVFVVVETALKYHRPAILDNWLRIETRITEKRRTNVVFEQAAYRGDELLVVSKIRVACLTVDTFRPAALPERLIRDIEVTEPRFFPAG